MVPRLSLYSFSALRLALDFASVFPFSSASSASVLRTSSFLARPSASKDSRAICFSASSTVMSSRAARFSASDTVGFSSTVGSASGVTSSSTVVSAACFPRSAAALSSAASVSLASAARCSASMFSCTEFCITACSASVNPSSAASFATLFARRVDAAF